MKKKVFAVFTAVFMIMALIPTAISFAVDNAVLKIHYNRPDNDYTDWNVWVWGDGMDGTAVQFADEDGEMVASAAIPTGVAQVGYIIRKGDWAAKDVDKDQFLDVSEVIGGTIHLYVESGVENTEFQLGDDAVTGVKVNTARYDGANIITVTTTGKIDAPESAFSVKGNGGDIAIEKVETVSDKEYNLTIAETLDTVKAYYVTFEGVDNPVKMPSVFSTPEFEENFTYNGDDLGFTYTSSKTSFRVWAPTASAVKVNLYESGTAGTDDLIEAIDMTADVNGTWIAEKEGDLNGKYYTYTVTIGDTVNEDVVDPYARSTGLNGARGMVLDLSKTNPDGWNTDKDPNAGKTINDAIIYELHIRDLSMDENSGIENKGKYLGLTETGTKTPSGISTGLDHIKELGITHLHILPMYDFGSVDESKTDVFNWGYDPQNYNVPEGSYSTDPTNGEVRVKEAKQMVKALHDNGISVVMDVVYNHVYSASDFCFNKIVPMYFSRIDENGNFSNASGCGNDTASERSMVKKYIVDSVNYWADEYHIDGFRFDLVGLIDVDTINEIVETVHKKHPNVIFYGEGWTMSTVLTKSGYTLATQTNSTKTPDFAYFSDTIRDGIKGNVFNSDQPGFVSGLAGEESKIQQCFMGLAGDWCKTPAQSINYASCHDNNTLIDRIELSTPDATREERVKMNNLSAAIYMTSEGVPFMMSGEEMLRSKVKADGTFDENSYNNDSGDFVNALKWATLDEEEVMNTFEYYKGLIAFRKAHPALRLNNADDVKANVSAVEGTPANTVAMKINGGVNGEESDMIYVIFNANKEAVEFSIPEGEWNVCIEGNKAGTSSLRTVSDGKVTVEGISALVMTLGANPQAPANSGSTASTGASAANNNNNTESGGFPWVPVGIGGGVVVVGAAAAIIVNKKKKS